MIQDRLITIIESEKLSTKKLEELTHIDRYKWGHIKSKSQRLNAEHIEAFIAVFPEYAYWLATGQEIPAAGQISPATKKAQQGLNKTGVAG